MNIKTLVTGTTARFAFYRDGNLWYEIEGHDFEFPIPVHDTHEIGGATFNREEKGIHMMRYIRKHLATLERKEN
jgi:hypothetical protein